MWQLLDKNLSSRFILGTALYPSIDLMLESIETSKTHCVTVSLKRSLAQGKSQKENRFWQSLKETKCHILPNTAGCRNYKEAVTMAEMARDIFKTNWIKVEVIGDDYNLQPDPFELLKACEILIEKGFEILPYCTDDLILAKRLVEMGAKVLMPWAAPIGSGKGIINPYALSVLRERFPDITLIIDAGIGLPSEAAFIMEMGFDGVLLNSAVALSGNPPLMAKAFSNAILAGRDAYLAKRMPQREMAKPSTNLMETPFWQVNPKKLS